MQIVPFRMIIKQNPYKVNYLSLINFHLQDLDNKKSLIHCSI